MNQASQSFTHSLISVASLSNPTHLSSILLPSLASATKMKFSIISTLLAATASALPAGQDAAALEARQLGGSITRNDLADGNSGSCPGVIFIYARGSTEAGNLVSDPPLTPK
jgi:hypothetical protein